MTNPGLVIAYKGILPYEWIRPRQIFLFQRRGRSQDQLFEGATIVESVSLSPQFFLVCLTS
jgi:hypothetical protein